MYEFILDSDVPQVYKDITGHTCKFCNEELVVNENRTIVKCPNPKCPKRIAESINAITTNIGIKGIGPEVSMSYVREYGYRKVTDFFIKPPYEIREAVNEYALSIRSVTEAVMSLCIPKLKEKTALVFGDYNSMEEFFEDIDRHPDYIWGVLIDIFSYGGNYLEMLETLINNMDDLFMVDGIFKGITPKRADNEEILILISEKPNSNLLYNVYGVRPDKKDFVKRLNEMFNDYGYSFISKDSFSRSVDYVVHDGNGRTEKAKKGKEAGKLVTSDQLIMTFMNELIRKGVIKSE